MLVLIVERNELLKPLQNLISIADKKHNMPILSSVLVTVEEGRLYLKVSDLDTEIVSYTELKHPSTDGKTVVPARKLYDIIRNLPEESLVSIKEEKNTRIIISCNCSRFSISALKAADFPSINEDTTIAMFKLSSSQLNSAIKRVKFAMAINDVRYFLNGMLWEIHNNYFRTVATDGHRMAKSEVFIQDTFLDSLRIIIPSKAIKETERLLSAHEDSKIEIQVGKNYFRIILVDLQFTSKLIDGRFPDYTRIVPLNNDKLLIANRIALKQALRRTSILSNEVYRGVRLELKNNLLLLSANNPEHEEAQDQIKVSYSSHSMEIGFNINYLLDIIDVLDSEEIHLHLDNPQMSLLIKDNSNNSTYILSPIKL